MKWSHIRINYKRFVRFPFDINLELYYYILGPWLLPHFPTDFSEICFITNLSETTRIKTGLITYFSGLCMLFFEVISNDMEFLFFKNGYFHTRINCITWKNPKITRISYRVATRRLRVHFENNKSMNENLRHYFCKCL